MDMVLASSHLDWVTISKDTLNTPVFGTKGRERVEIALALMSSHLDLPLNVKWIPRMTSKHYAWTFSDIESGVTVDIPKDNDEAQGLRIVAAGSSYMLRSVRSLRLMLSKGWRPSRVDLCWNIQNVSFNLLDIYLKWRELSPKSGVLRPDMIGDKQNGETFTIGARTSDFYARLYDKGHKNGGQGGQFLRAEFELKGRYVKELFETEFDMVDSCAMEMYRKGGFFPEIPVLHNVFSHVANYAIQTGEIIVGRKITDREKWMREQVVPAFRNLAKEDYEAAREIAEIFSAIAMGATEQVGIIV